jgi:hypothetical protein
MEKEVYEKPGITSEPVFEALMAGCTITVDDLTCQVTAINGGGAVNVS